MLNQRETSAYQAAAANGATQAGLLQLVYMHLAKDLLKAADAVRKKDTAARCTASHHALLLLGYLESWVENIQEPDLASSLQAFYQMLRTSILQLQTSLSIQHFEQLSQFVLDTSAAWRAKEESLSATFGNSVSTHAAEAESISFQA